VSYMKQKFSIVFLCASFVLVSGSSSAQDDFFEVDEESEADEGLQSATPSNSVNELNPNSGNQFSDNEVGEGDFPAANSESGNLNFDTGNNGASNNVFGDEPVNNGTAGPGVSAYGNPVPGNNTGNGQAPAQSNPIPANPIQANPLQQAAPQQVPVQAPNQVPGNAQSLMNQINQVPTANAGLNPVNPAAAPPVTDVPVEGATAPDALMPTNPEPAISAPPLPPPNEFAGSPPVPGTMRLLAESEAPEEYMVQPGDTLFDICDQLLDEPGYWPKLWALNPEIKNPHFIFPNMRLKFYPGDDETPPYLQVVAEEELIPIEKGDLDEQDLIAEKVIFEIEEEQAGSLAVDVIGSDELDAVTDMILSSGDYTKPGEVRVQVPGFILEEEKEAEGYIISGRDGEFNMGPGVKTFVESDGGIAAGTLYTVIRPGSEVRDPETNDFIGYKYYFVANIRISKSVEEGLFIGSIEGNRLAVQNKDMVVSFISTFRTVPLGSSVGSISNIDSRLVGFEFEGQELGGSGGFAFLSKGSSDGISPGMYVGIYQNPGFLSPSSGKSDLPVDPEFVGILRIIDATPAGAVGWIVKNIREMRIGDKTGKG
jgi:hypothetical protein